jgi:hypothetical protein
MCFLGAGLGENDRNKIAIPTFSSKNVSYTKDAQR